MVTSGSGEGIRRCNGDDMPHNTKVFNLCQIRKMGLENWAQKKARGVRDTYFKGLFKL